MGLSKNIGNFFSSFINKKPLLFFGSIIALFGVMVLIGTGTVYEWIYPHMSAAEQQAQNNIANGWGMTLGGWIALGATIAVFAVVIYFAVKERSSNANKYFGKDAGTGYDKDLEK